MDITILWKISFMNHINIFSELSYLYKVKLKDVDIHIDILYLKINIMYVYIFTFRFTEIYYHLEGRT